MDSKKGKVDPFAKFQKKAGEKDKAVKRDSGSDKPDSALESVEIPPEQSKVESGESKGTEADSGPKEVSKEVSVAKESTKQKLSAESPKESPKPNPQPAAAPPAANNKLDRWLSKAAPAAASGPNVAVAPPAAPSSSTDKAESATSTPQKASSVSQSTPPPPSGPAAPPPAGAQGSKPIFGTPFQGLEEGSGWCVMVFKAKFFVMLISLLSQQLYIC